jgi:hypothetical protein
MNNFEDKLEEIRLKLYEETKNMDKMDAINFINENARKIVSKYNLSVLYAKDDIGSVANVAING